MKTDSIRVEDPRIQSAISELRGIITQRYAHATFEAAAGEDPEGIYLTATVDLDDTTEVMDTVVDRLVDMQVEEGLPVYVVTVQPISRVIEQMKSATRATRPRIDRRDIPRSSPNPARTSRRLL